MPGMAARPRSTGAHSPRPHRTSCGVLTQMHNPRAGRPKDAYPCFPFFGSRRIMVACMTAISVGGSGVAPV